MRKHFCKYHPKEPARWDCEDCNIKICGDCATTDTVHNEAFCPVCKSQLNQVVATNFIEPFWNRIPRFFKYPLNLQSAIFISMIGAFFTLAPYGGFMTFWLWIVLSFAVVRYSMLVLETSADGRDTPPAVSLGIITDGFGLTLKLFATYFVFGYAVSWIAKNIGTAGAILAGIFVLVCIPASTMVIASTKNFFAAVNPVFLAGVIRRIGLPYVILYIFLILLSVCQTIVSAIVASLDIFWLSPVSNMIGLFFTLIMFNMMGYTIFQYHEQLDYPVRLDVGKNYSGTKPKARKAQAVHSALQEAQLLVKEGNIPEAANRLAKAVEGFNVPLDVHAYYHKLLFKGNLVQQMQTHANKYINILLANNNVGDAARLVCDCYSRNVVLRPADPNNFYALVSSLKEKSAFKECMALIQNFHKLHPEHQDIPKLYLLGAHILAEELHNRQMAHKIMHFLKTRYSQHETASEINQYYKVTKSLAS